jgi:Carboxypeptidase regulatory-like domain
MYATVENYCTENTNIISANIAFVTAFGDFKAKIAAVNVAAQLDDRKITGITVDKNKIRQSLCEQAADAASIITAYAATVGDNTLLKAVNFPISTLAKTSEDTLVPRCQNIHDAGETNLPALKDYGLTGTILTALQTSINDFAAAVAKPRTAISERKTVTENLVVLFKATDEILEMRMDKLVNTFKTTNPDFVKTYEAARRTLKPPTTTTQLKGIVTDKLTGAPIKNARITATPNDTDETTPPLVTTTDANGEYLFKPIIVDDYTITVTATGYQPFEDDEFHAALGDVNHFDIELVK